MFSINNVLMRIPLTIQLPYEAKRYTVRVTGRYTVQYLWKRKIERDKTGCSDTLRTNESCSWIVWHTTSGACQGSVRWNAI